MKVNNKYYQAKDGEWIEQRLYSFREQCCDCSLVHVVDYKIKCENGRHTLFVRSRRDERATKRIRDRRALAAIQRDDKA